MGGAIFDIEKFNGIGDFCMWKKKMKAVMMQLKVDAALDENPELPATMTSYENSEMFKIAYSTIFLHLTDNVLRHVDGLETAARIWMKLKELYLVKSPPNKIYLLEQLFGFKMDTSKTIDQNVDNCNKILLVRDAINGRDTLSTSIVINAIRTKEFDTKFIKEKSSGRNSGESYYTRGMSHYKKNCRKRIQDEKTNRVQENADAAVVSSESDFGDVLNVVTY
ncbi:hypothetical protein UlMin_028879 [Ulmus minor]